MVLLRHSIGLRVAHAGKSHKSVAVGRRFSRPETRYFVGIVFAGKRREFLRLLAHGNRRESERHGDPRDLINQKDNRVDREAISERNTEYHDRCDPAQKKDGFFDWICQRLPQPERAECVNESEPDEVPDNLHPYKERDDDLPDPLAQVKGFSRIIILRYVRHGREDTEVLLALQHTVVVNLQRVKNNDRRNLILVFGISISLYLGYEEFAATMVWGADEKLDNRQRD